MELLWITISSTIFILQSGSHAKDPEYLKTNSEEFCSKGWHPFGAFCYKGFSDRRNFENAEKECEKADGQLAVITSSEVQDFVTAKVLLPMGHRSYIGLRYNESANRFLWSDGSTDGFTAWDANEPSGKAPDEMAEHCVEMTFNDVLNRLGRWNDVSCNQELSYICQKLKDQETEELGEETSRCSWTLDGIYFRKSCFHLSLHRKTWEEAEKYCVEQYKGHLASIVDAAVQKFLHYEVVNHHAQQSILWIGIKLKPDEVALWSSGWYLGYSNWKDKEAHKKVSSESCAAMTRGGSGEWTLGSCNEYRPFICENSSVIPPPRLKAKTPGLKCPYEGWLDLGGDYCYIIDTKAFVSWYHANFLCMRKGGTLATIHSQEEEEVLAQFFRLVPNAIHIGLFRHDVSPKASGEFQWVDRSPLTYQHWRYGEPNSKEEICAEALPRQDMKWNDIKCENSGMFICSVSKEAPLQTTEEQPSDSKQDECECLPTPAIVGVVLCVLVVIILLGVVIYNVKPWMKARQQGNKNHKSSFVRERPRYRSREMVISERIYENMDRELYENMDREPYENMDREPYENMDRERFPNIDMSARTTSLP